SSVAITLRLPHEVVTLLGLPAALAFGHLRYGDNVCGRTEPEHDRTTGTHERQAPLDRGRRPCERLRERHTVHIRLLLLGATPDDTRVRRRPSLEEVALAPLRLEQGHPALRQRNGERY